MRTLTSILIFTILSLLSYWLLQGKQIQPNDFILLIIASFVIALVISYFDDIQELSIGGNSIVRLREAKTELKEAIIELKMIKLSTFRMLLLKSLDYSGGWGSTNLVDIRAKYFITLVNEIREVGCLNELKLEIKEPLNRLLKAQLDPLYRKFYEAEFAEGDEFPKPKQFYIDMNQEIIDRVKFNQTPVVEHSEKKRELISAIDTYAELYIILKEVTA